MFAEIKAYVADKVVGIVEDFINTNCEIVVSRFISPTKDDFWWAVTWNNNGRFTRFGFRFDTAPNTLMFYEFNGYSEKTDCYLWEFPNRIIDVSPHPMMTDAFMRKLWIYIDYLVKMETSIQSKYKSFIATVKRGERYKYLNAQYGLISSIPIHEEAKKITAAAIKGVRDSLLMSSCQSWDSYPGQEDDINCILNGPTKGYNKEENNMIISGIKNVFFNEVKKTTTVVFNDHTSVIVKCTDNDEFDPEMGLAMALARKCFGSRSKFQKAVAKWVATSAPKNEQLKKKAARKAEKEAAQIEHAKAQAESYME